MEDLAWVLWAVLGIIFIVAEVFTLGFFILWFGVGALAAALVAGLGFGVVTQFLVFLLVSIGLTAVSRTVLADKLLDQGDKIKSGTEGLVGKKAILMLDDTHRDGRFMVKVFGSTWTAASSVEGEPLEVGEKVEIVGVEGATLRVRKLDKALPDWRGDE